MVVYAPSCTFVVRHDGVRASDRDIRNMGEHSCSRLAVPSYVFKIYDVITMKTRIARKFPCDVSNMQLTSSVVRTLILIKRNSAVTHPFPVLTVVVYAPALCEDVLCSW